MGSKSRREQTECGLKGITSTPDLNKGSVSVPERTKTQSKVRDVSDIHFVNKSFW